MIVKPFVEGNAIERLTALLDENAERSKDIEGEIRKVRAGLKGEREAAHYIDATLAGSDNYAIIHGLRLETPHGVAQLDHVLINRMMVVFILETKHFRDGLKITEEGEFLRWSNWERQYQAMPSPLMQCDRHEAGLKDFLKANDVFPRRFGMRTAPEVRSLVLVNPEATLLRPSKFDTSKVVKADQFFPAIQKEFDKLGFFATLGKVAQSVSTATLREIAEGLVSHDRPIEIDYAGKLGIKRVQASNGPSPGTSPVSGAEAEPEAKPVEEAKATVELGAKNLGAPNCKACASTNGEIRFGKFGYYWKCLACDGNTKLALPGPGKLRKEGPRFFYVEDGKAEALFHHNATGVPEGTATA